MKTTINCYFAHAWDSETHPDLADRKAAIALAKSLSPNVKNFEYEGKPLGDYSMCVILRS